MIQTTRVNIDMNNSTTYHAQINMAKLNNYMNNDQ